MERAIKLNELRKVKGIGKKTMDRVKEQIRDDNYVSEYNPDLHLDKNSINQGDCLELMNGIEDKSIDMILADLPYGTITSGWDESIDLDKLWLQYERIIKDDGIVCLTADQPFSSELVKSKEGWFRYNWVWNKNSAGNILNSSFQPLKITEEILIFSKNKPRYFPILKKGCKDRTNENPVKKKGNMFADIKSGEFKRSDKNKPAGTRYPKNLINISKQKTECRNGCAIHETQKPVALFEYLIKTYTNEGDLILDNVSGSGTTAVACINTDRSYICIEQNEEYYQKSIERIAKADAEFGDGI